MVSSHLHEHVSDFPLVLCKWLLDNACALEVFDAQTQESIRKYTLGEQWYFDQTRKYVQACILEPQFLV